MRSGQHKIKCFGFILFIATWCNEGWSTKSQIFRFCVVYIGIYKISCNICAKKFLLESYNPSNLIFLKIFIERSYFILNITKGAYWNRSSLIGTWRPWEYLQEEQKRMKTDSGFRTRAYYYSVEWLTACNNLDEYALKLHSDDRDATSLVKTFCC